MKKKYLLIPFLMLILSLGQAQNSQSLKRDTISMSEYVYPVIPTLILEGEEEDKPSNKPLVLKVGQKARLSIVENPSLGNTVSMYVDNQHIIKIVETINPNRKTYKRQFIQIPDDDTVGLVRLQPAEDMNLLSPEEKKQVVEYETAVPPLSGEETRTDYIFEALKEGKTSITLQSYHRLDSQGMSAIDIVVQKK